MRYTDEYVCIYLSIATHNMATHTGINIYIIAFDWKSHEHFWACELFFKKKWLDSLLFNASVEDRNESLKIHKVLPN